MNTFINNAIFYSTQIENAILRVRIFEESVRRGTQLKWMRFVSVKVNPSRSIHSFQNDRFRW